MALMSKAVRRAPFDSLIQEITHTNSAAHTADERKRPSRSLVPSQLLRRGEQRAQLIARPELKAGRSGRLLERGNLLAQQGQRASQRRRHPRLVHARLGLGYLQQRVLLATLEVQSCAPHDSAATRRAALEPHRAELAWRAARPRQLRRPLARDWLPAREVAEKCLLPRGAATRAALPHLLEGARLQDRRGALAVAAPRYATRAARAISCNLGRLRRTCGLRAERTRARHAESVLGVRGGEDVRGMRAPWRWRQSGAIGCNLVQSRAISRLLAL
mmetsp:Transcript_11777/g.38544  ORF Transcript_11777/g.38544 Transcript_11777/m.38544 type:complete len:274 (+) Transcript_11777:72-893(+)